MHSSGPIIIVDDDTDDHYVIHEVILKLAVDNPVRIFRSGAELLNYLRTTEEQPFVILCDINMPMMDGLEVRRIIDSDPALKTKSIPFVYYTTAASPKQIREAYDLTVQGFFIKNSTFDDTERTLKLILDYWDQCKHPNSDN